MRKILLTAGLGLVALTARAEIYKCTDGAGHITYSNVVSRGCQKLNLEPESVVPSAAKASRAPSPASFPRVPESAQKARDNDRHKILEQELAAEQKSLGDARKALTEAADAHKGSINDGRIDERTQPIREEISQHERNIDAINQELSGLH